MTSIMVKVVPGAKQIRIEPMLSGLKIWLTAKPEDGAANRQLIEVLADHFKVSKSSVIIKSGHTSRVKVVAIRE